MTVVVILAVNWVEKGKNIVQRFVIVNVWQFRQPASLSVLWSILGKK